jgi:gas vesicle protein
MSRHHDDDDEVVLVEKRGSPVAPLLWGIAIGAAIGLLFAPMSGEELRSEIGRRGRRLKSLAEDKAEELEEMISDRYASARERVEEGVDGARKKVKEGKQFAHDVADAGRAAALTAREELERRLAEAREARRAPKPSGDEDPVA